MVYLLSRKTDLGLPGEVSNLLACAMGFGLGVVVYAVRRHGWLGQWARAGRTIATLVELATVAIALALAWSFGGRTSPLIFPAFALMVWVFSHEAGLLSDALKTKPMLLLGLLSYSIYMVHQFIQDRMLDLIAAAHGAIPLTVPQSGRIVLAGNPLLCDLVTIVMLALVIGASWLTYHYVEDPARQLSRHAAGRIGGGRKPG